MPQVRHPVAIYAHGHPKLQSGGTEVASYNLYTALKEQRRFAPLYLTHCANRAIDSLERSVVPIEATQDQYVFFEDDLDPFFLVNRNASFLVHQLAEFLKRHEIKVFHAHHFMGLGINAFPMLKTLLPEMKICLTLHEFLSICQHHGQMITTKDRNLCEMASALRCGSCFPDHGPLKFKVREALFKRAYSSIDAFIAPSHFLRERFIAWGLDPDKIHYLENAQRTDAHATNPQGLTKNMAIDKKNRFRFGVFGSFNPFKGLPLILEAARQIQAQTDTIEIAVYGSIQHVSPEEQAQFKANLDELSPTLRYYGSYPANDAVRLMSRCDWIVVPSIWWENSPVVIEEALIAGKPLLVADIGGMKEKVQDGVFGLHFRARDGADLADKMLAIASDPNQARFSANVRPVKSLEAAASEHAALYDRLMRAA